MRAGLRPPSRVQEPAAQRARPRDGIIGFRSERHRPSREAPPRTRVWANRTGERTGGHLPPSAAEPEDPGRATMRDTQAGVPSA